MIHTDPCAARSRPWSSLPGALWIALGLTVAVAPRPASGDPPEAAGCAVFPVDNIWNVPVDHLPVDAGSDFEAVDVSSLMVDPDSGQTSFTGIFSDGFEWGEVGAWSSTLP